MIAGYGKGPGLWLQECCGAQTLAFSRNCLIHAFLFHLRAWAIPSSLPLHPHIFIWSVGPEHNGPTARFLFITNNLGLVCLAQGAGYGGWAGDRVSYQLNQNCLVNAQQEEPLFLALGATSKARVDFSHI